MRIAVEGCAHGELEKIYETISEIEKQENYKIDLLICCGDFQASRNLNDLQSMAVPKKYQQICTFYKYYSGEKIAPILTIFIGGNHEASNHLQELPYGGWVAPNIYYLGYAGVVNVNGIRIAGLSGIYKGHDFLKGHHEFPPYDESTRKSVYHTRQLEVYRLKQLSGDIDIFISHDWPRGIYNFGNSKQLIRFKPHFREEIETNRLGSPACEDLLNTIQPKYWFSAHMHCKFAALVPHKDSEKITKFLALDKCLPRRRFLQILDIDKSKINTDIDDDITNNDETNVNEELKFEYDIEWLTILYLTNHLINVKNAIYYMPGPNGSERYNFTPTDDEKNIIRTRFSNNFSIPENFIRNTESYDPKKDINNFSTYNTSSTIVKLNPQTTKFCDKLCIDDPLHLAMVIKGYNLNQSSTSENEMNYSSFIEVHDQTGFNSTFDNISPLKRKSLSLSLPEPKFQKDVNDEEINLDDDDDDGDNEDVEDNDDDDNDNDEKNERIFDTTENETNSTINISSETTHLECRTTESQSSKEANNDNTENCSNPPIKKFKRRNQSIYTSNDENV